MLSARRSSILAECYSTILGLSDTSVGAVRSYILSLSWAEGLVLRDCLLMLLITVMGRLRLSWTTCAIIKYIPLVMRSSQHKGAPEPTNSKDFFKVLEQRFNSLKSSTDSSIRDSDARTRKPSLKAKKSNDKPHARQCFRVLDLSSVTQQIRHSVNKDEHQFEQIIGCPNELAQLVDAEIRAGQPKFVSIRAETLGGGHECKIQSVCGFVEPVVRRFERAAVCIYSIGNKNDGFVYDMLSIRRQTKSDTRLLVQTNICNNSKSGVILRKLFEVARERERALSAEVDIAAVVVRVRGASIAGKENTSEGGEVEVELSCGDYGELGSRSLMGIEKMRVFYDILSVGAEITEKQELDRLLSPYQHKKAVDERKLILKIKSLQEELAEKKRELEAQKKKVEEERQTEEQLQDMVLPSERPMVSFHNQHNKAAMGIRRPAKLPQKCT